MMRGQIPLPNSVLTFLSPCPAAGKGVHHWLFCEALRLHRLFQDAADIANILETASCGCGRRISRREIEDAVRNSRRYALGRSASFDNGYETHSWPSRDYEKIRSMAEKHGGLYDLWEGSPRRFEDNASHSVEIIEALFPGDPLLCCGTQQWDFDTRRKSEWRRGLMNLQFIVPSEMSRKRGSTQEGKASAHTLDNTGPRRFLVVEFDFTPQQGEAVGTQVQDLCASLIFELRRFAPLALVVHSGGKSLHAWFYSWKQQEQDLQKFMRYAVSLGADPHTWTRSQFVRMPDGYRSDGNRQAAYFFDPDYQVRRARR
jgi:hypothetical protein